MRELFAYLQSHVLLYPGKRVSMDMMHCTDWLPTILSLAGGNTTHLTTLDGMNMWPTISEGVPSPRKEILLNIDSVNPRENKRGSEAIRVGDWKLVQEKLQWSGWYPPDDDNSTTSFTSGK